MLHNPIKISCFVVILMGILVVDVAGAAFNKIQNGKTIHRWQDKKNNSIIKRWIYLSLGVFS